MHWESCGSVLMYWWAHFTTASKGDFWLQMAQSFAEVHPYAGGGEMVVLQLVEVVHVVDVVHVVEVIQVVEVVPVTVGVLVQPVVAPPVPPVSPVYPGSRIWLPQEAVRRRSEAAARRRSMRRGCAGAPGGAP
jgi:hypothetical protein